MGLTPSFSVKGAREGEEERGRGGEEEEGEESGRERARGRGKEDKPPWKEERGKKDAMAEKLVTQVRNPAAAGQQEGEDGVYIDVVPNEEDLRTAPPPSHCCARWRMWWGDCVAACLSCLPCRCCRPSEARAARGRRRLSLPGRKSLLPPQRERDRGKKTLILDLDETLVHSSFQPVPGAHFVLKIELDGEVHSVYVLKRPGVDEFLRAVAERWEVVVFTASLAKYADPLLDMLDPDGLVAGRLFRDACVQHYGNYVKDLSLMGRSMRNICIVDNSPYSYIFQPDNALAVTSWFNDESDRQLRELVPIMEDLSRADDVARFLTDGQHVLLRQHNERVEQHILMQQRLMLQSQMHVQMPPSHALASAPRVQQAGLDSRASPSRSSPPQAIEMRRSRGRSGRSESLSTLAGDLGAS